jgi:predicted metal-dependent phosphoesterase TrpH
MQKALDRPMLSKADIHVHTKYSGLAHYKFLKFPESASNPEDVVKIAKKVGLSVLCITDHNSIAGALKAREYAKNDPDIEVVIGEEVSTRDGEVIGLFLTEEIPMDLSAEETILRIRKQGGLVLAPHPYSGHVSAIGNLIEKLDIDGIEVINGGHIDGIANNKALESSKCGRWACVAGSDAHALGQLGCCCTMFEGKTAQDLRAAILNKTTQPYGSSTTLDRGIRWSIGVVLYADKLVLKSFFGMLREEDPNDPVIKVIKNMSAAKKIVTLFGSLFFLTPPVPYLVGITSEKILKKWNNTVNQKNAEATRKRGGTK